MSEERIFIVEDETEGAQDIAASLQSMGYVVAGKTSRGEIAIGQAGELRPDLVLMDIRLQSNARY